MLELRLWGALFFLQNEKRPQELLECSGHEKLKPETRFFVTVCNEVQMKTHLLHWKKHLYKITPHSRTDGLFLREQPMFVVSRSAFMQKYTVWKRRHHLHLQQFHDASWTKEDSWQLEFFFSVGSENIPSSGPTVQIFCVCVCARIDPQSRGGITKSGSLALLIWAWHEMQMATCWAKQCTICPSPKTWLFFFSFFLIINNKKYIQYISKFWSKLWTCMRGSLKWS